MLKLVFPRFTSSGFAQNAIILTAGTVITQLIPVLLQPFLRRYFTATEYGVFSIYLSIVSILSVVATLRYENAIAVSKSDLKASNVMALSVVTNLAISVLLMFVTIIAGNALQEYFRIPPGFEYMLYLVPAGVFLFCLQQSINTWLLRNNDFSGSSGNKISRRIAEGGVHMTTGIQKIPSGLILGEITGGIIGCVTAILRLVKNGFETRMISSKLMKYVSVRYVDFPKFNLLPTLCNAIALQLPLLLINRYFELRNVAEFDLARQMLSVPMILAAATYSQVLLHKLTEKRRNNLSVRKLLNKVLFVLLIIIAVEIIILKVWGPDLFGYVFGTPWAASGQISKILVFNFALNLIMTSFISIFIAFNKIKYYSIWQILYFLLMLSLIFFEPLPYRLFVLAYVIIDSVLIITGLVVLWSIVFKYERMLRKTVTTY